MPVQFHQNPFTRLDSTQLSEWDGVGSAEVSDCLGRSMAMHGAIKPIDREMRIVGQARTVSCMVADNGALHAAVNVAAPGDVLVAAAQAFEDVAVWGGLMTRAAIIKGIAGLVVDGAVRDSGEIRELGFPCFSRAVAPRGPHKGFGGTVDAPIACAGVPVSPGDLVIGDADGVAIVPFGLIDETLTAVRALQKREAQTIEKMGSGASLSEIYGVPEIVIVEHPDD